MWNEGRVVRVMGGKWGVRGGSGAGLLNVWVIDRTAHYWAGSGIWARGSNLAFGVQGIDHQVFGQVFGLDGSAPYILVVLGSGFML